MKLGQYIKDLTIEKILSGFLAFINSFIALLSLAVSLAALKIAADDRNIKAAVGNLSTLASAASVQTENVTRAVNTLSTVASGVVKEASYSAIAAKAAADSNLLQESHFEITERPVLDFSNDLPSYITDGGRYDLSSRKIIWNFSVKNFGATAAEDVDIQAYLSNSDNHVFVCSTPGNCGNGSIPTQIVQGAERMVTVEDHRPVSLDWFQPEKIKDFYIYLVLTISYKDLSGNKYEDDICLAQSADGKMIVCPSGPAWIKAIKAGAKPQND